MQWDPSQYLRFASHRLRPAVELLQRVTLDAPRRVYDLGAGAGNVTALLAGRWPEAQVIGVDSSAEMLQRAALEAPRLRFEQADLNDFVPETPADLLFSNAVLHWLGDHRSLLTRWMGCLEPGGVLAVQMPNNFREPSHTAIADVVRNGPWRSRLEATMRSAPVANPAFYLDFLAPLSASLDVWETVYYHVLEGVDPVREWTGSTALAPVLAHLEGAEREAFEADYTARLSHAYPRRADGRTVFPFRRLFIVATRGK